MIHVEVWEQGREGTVFTLAVGDRPRLLRSGRPHQIRLAPVEGSAPVDAPAEQWADRWLILVSMLTGLATDEVENEGFVVIRDGEVVPVPAGVEMLRVEVQH